MRPPTPADRAAGTRQRVPGIDPPYGTPVVHVDDPATGDDVGRARPRHPQRPARPAGVAVGVRLRPAGRRHLQAGRFAGGAVGGPRGLRGGRGRRRPAPGPPPAANWRRSQPDDVAPRRRRPPRWRRLHAPDVGTTGPASRGPRRVPALRRRAGDPRPHADVGAQGPARLPHLPVRLRAAARERGHLVVRAAARRADRRGGDRRAAGRTGPPGPSRAADPGRLSLAGGVAAGLRRASSRRGSPGVWSPWRSGRPAPPPSRRSTRSCSATCASSTRAGPSPGSRPSCSSCGCVGIPRPRRAVAADPRRQPR